MKKIYEEPEMTVYDYQVEDAICDASNTNANGDNLLDPTEIEW